MKEAGSGRCPCQVTCRLRSKHLDHTAFVRLREHRGCTRRSARVGPDAASRQGACTSLPGPARGCLQEPVPVCSDRPVGTQDRCARVSQRSKLMRKHRSASNAGDHGNGWSCHGLAVPEVDRSFCLRLRVTIHGTDARWNTADSRVTQGNFLKVTGRHVPGPRDVPETVTFVFNADAGRPLPSALPAATPSSAIKCSIFKRFIVRIDKAHVGNIAGLRGPSKVRPASRGREAAPRIP